MTLFASIIVRNLTLTLVYLYFREQIQQNSEKKKQDRLDFLEEGKKIRQRLEDERMKVEGIKQRKMNELNDLGISDKYKAELAKKKIT